AANRARPMRSTADRSGTPSIWRATLRFGSPPDATRDDTSRRASDARATVDAGNASGTTVILVQVNASRARTRRRIACSVLQRANPSRDGDAKLPLLGDRRGGRAAEALRTRLRSLRLGLWRRPRDKAVAREDRPCLVIIRACPRAASAPLSSLPPCSSSALSPASRTQPGRRYRARLPRRCASDLGTASCLQHPTPIHLDAHFV